MTVKTQKITPFLWFDKEAGEAAALYTSLFPNSKILTPESYSDTPTGDVAIYTIELSGQQFNLLNAGPHHTFNEAISFVIDCKDQDEVDYYWEGLTASGGEESMCGWLKDRFGVSWQVVPRRFTELMSDEDPGKVERVMQCMLRMKKLVVAELEEAYKGP